MWAHRNQNHFIHPEPRAHRDLFIGGYQGSYYNIVTALNYLSQL
jgi:hypothetical protein